MKTNYVCNECQSPLTTTNSEYCTLCAPHMITKEDSMSSRMKELELKLQAADDWHTFKTYLAEATNADEVYAIKRELMDKYPAAVERQEKALDKRCRNLAYTFNKEERKVEAGVKNTKLEMAKADEWLEANGMLDKPLPSELDNLKRANAEFNKELMEALQAKLDSGEITETQAIRLKLEQYEAVSYADWETEAIDFYKFINDCRTATGEDVGINWAGRKANSNVSSDAQDSDTGAPDMVDSSAPMDHSGMLETAIKKFNEGITTGKQFDNSFRTSYFEEGLNSSDSYHADIEFIGTESAANKIRKMNEAYTKNLVVAMQEDSDRINQRVAIADLNITKWMDSAKEDIKLKVSVSKNRKDAEYINCYKSLAKLVRKETKFFDMPYLNVKEITGVFTREEALEELKVAKGRNSALITELEEFKKELVAEKYASAFAVFTKVQGYLAMLLETVDINEAVKELKKENAYVSKAECKAALEIASSRKNDCRFSKEEFTILARAKYVVRKRATKKKVDNVSPATAELIAKLQEGQFDVATEDNAKEILKAAASGSKYRLEKSTYNYIKELANVA